MSELEKFILSFGHDRGYAWKAARLANEAHRHPTKGWRGPAIGVGWKRAYIEYLLRVQG